ncbi:hypothetical protein MKW92_024272 [Papaver armeniacum]|nr:hypothetical protein MKW92_024272 [Papaver armeniacum]
MRCNTSYDPPKLVLQNFEVLSISETELRVGTMITDNCYDESGYEVPGTTSSLNLVASVFTVSYTNNRLFGIGCEIVATLIGISGDNETLTSSNSCVSKCRSRRNLFEGACTGTSGCCQTTVLPKGLKTITSEVSGLLPRNPPISSYNSCTFAYVAEVGQDMIPASDLLLDGGVRKNTTVIPVVLDWAIGDMNCEQAKEDMETYACQNNSYCYEPVNTQGYLCTCSKGYKGNPYLEPGCEGMLLIICIQQ